MINIDIEQAKILAEIVGNISFGTLTMVAFLYLGKKLLVRFDRASENFKTGLSDVCASYERSTQIQCDAFRDEVAKCHEERAKLQQLLLDTITSKQG